MSRKKIYESLFEEGANRKNFATQYTGKLPKYPL